MNITREQLLQLSSNEIARLVDGLAADTQDDIFALLADLLEELFIPDSLIPAELLEKMRVSYNG